MKSWIPKAAVISVALSTAMSFIGGESFSGMHEMRASLERQRARNAELKATLVSLKDEVHGLTKDQRVLERAARNELAMVRPNEEIVIFEREPDEK
jgi:cell division protein FtsB